MRTRDESKEKAIRQKALQMTVKEGFDGLSMQKLAKAAGVSPATIYIYFEDRDDLIMKIFEDLMGRMAEITMKDFSPDMTFEEGLSIQWRNRAEFFTKYPLEVQFMEQMRHSPFNKKCMPLQMKLFKESMGKFVENAIKRKELMPLPFEVYWSIAFSPLYQLVKFHVQ